MAITRIQEMRLSNQSFLLAEAARRYNDSLDTTNSTVISQSKISKSAFLAGFLSQWKYGDGEFLGHKVLGDCPPVIISGTDQNLLEWQGISHGASADI